jgi:hypothetical protein
MLPDGNAEPRSEFQSNARGGTLEVHAKSAMQPTEKMLLTFAS